MFTASGARPEREKTIKDDSNLTGQETGRVELPIRQGAALSAAG